MGEWNVEKCAREAEMEGEVLEEAGGMGGGRELGRIGGVDGNSG